VSSASPHHSKYAPTVGTVEPRQDPHAGGDAASSLQYEATFPNIIDGRGKSPATSPRFDDESITGDDADDRIEKIVGSRIKKVVDAEGQVVSAIQ